MKIGMITDSLPGTTLGAMLDVAAGLEMDQLEFARGNWLSAPHVDLDAMLESDCAARVRGQGCRPRHLDRSVDALRANGYDGVLSIEHEDPAMSPEEGVAESVALLRRVLDRPPLKAAA
jgi:sugar phosphate isomerase/epimerase